MASGVLRQLRRASSLPHPSASLSSIKATAQSWRYVLFQSTHLVPLSSQNPLWVSRNLSCGRFNLGVHESTTLQNLSCLHRNFSYGRVSLVLSEGKPKFETHEVDPPKKDRFLTKKRFGVQKRREKEKRKAANRKDPRRLTVKGDKKKKFSNAEERIKCKLERAKIKEGLLLEKLKRYEVPKAQGPEVQPHDLSGEEKFFMKKMAQKSSNYVPVGRRGIFGGVILNMHMHWKKHETVKVICKCCKPGQVHQYADDIARLSGGIPLQILGDDTIIFYRGKNYVQPEVMSPVDTLSKKKALEKSKYQQSLESVRRFIAIAEKELELYYRHIALYGDPNDRNPMSILESPVKYSKVSRKPKRETDDPAFKNSTEVISPVGPDSHYHQQSSDSEDERIQDDLEDNNLSVTESDSEDDSMSDSNDETQDGFEVSDPSICQSTISR